ncbi:MAG: PCRF domain-containing protein, partial [Candidatus Neomarinimicrobiota bacterium]
MILEQLAQEATWSDLELSQSLNKEKAELEKFLDHFLDTESQLSDNLEILEMAIEENDSSAIKEIQTDFNKLEESVEELEFNRMFSNKADPNSAFVDIQSGSGGTEAQDWAEMLQRMYMRWAESR